MEQKYDESFGKKYKCCSKKIIEQLFENKQFLKVYPIISYYKYNDYTFEKTFQIVISVPKRNFKKAHERNKIKRVLKEVIRKNKYILENELNNFNKKLAIFLIYSTKEELKYVILNEKIKILFNKLIKEIKINEIN